MVFALDKTLSFPDPHLGEPDGLLAVGGDLSVDRMLLAYSYGIFPWYSFRYNREILWYCPMQRFVIFPAEVHVSHSMRSLINRGTYHVTFNQEFDEVIRHCSRLRIKEDGAIWQQLLLKGDARKQVLAAYSIVSIPQILLVSPDGTIIAKDLRGNKIYEAVQKALAK